MTFLAYQSNRFHFVSQCEIARCSDCTFVLTPFQALLRTVNSPCPPSFPTDPEYEPEPEPSRSQPAPKRSKRAPMPGARCATCNAKFIPMVICQPCQRTSEVFITDRSKGFWEDSSVIHGYVMEEVGKKVKPRAKINVEVKIRPCSIDGFQALRRRFLQSRCAPGITLQVPWVQPGRGATTSVLPKVWTMELTDWATCGAIFTPAWRRPGRQPGLFANGLVVMLPNRCAYVALPPFRFKLTSMCPLGKKQGRASLRYDCMILSDTGDWVPPQENFPNLQDLMMGASLDVLKIERARMTSRSLGGEIPLLPPAMVDAAFNTLPPEYWPYPRPPFTPASPPEHAP